MTTLEPRQGRAGLGPGVRQTPQSHTSRAILGAGLLGGIATTSGIALTATSGWLIVRASQRPPILLLFTAIVAVRAFGMARPAFRYWERLRSHDAALADRTFLLKDGSIGWWGGMSQLPPGEVRAAIER